MATVRENIKNALTWFYDRLKDKYLDPFDKRISDNTTNIATNATNIAANTTDISGKAPTSHASSGTTYGVGTTSNYGHCRTINNLTTSSHTNGYALSAYQGYLLNSDISTANTNITKNAEDISTLNTDLTTLSTRAGNRGTYTGDIDDLYGTENTGGYWCYSTDCSGDQPFGDSTTSRYYYLEVSYSNDGHVQRAVRYDTGAVKYRVYNNHQWYGWGDIERVNLSSDVKLGSMVTNTQNYTLFTFGNMGLLYGLLYISPGTYGQGDALMTLPIGAVSTRHFAIISTGGSVYDGRLETSGMVDFNSSQTFSSNTYLVLNSVFPLTS